MASPLILTLLKSEGHMERIDYCANCEALGHVWHQCGLCDDCARELKQGPYAHPDTISIDEIEHEDDDR